MKSEKLKRNLNLWHDRKQGFTYQALSEKYHITKERCRQIFLRMDRKATKTKLNSLYGKINYIDTDIIGGNTNV